MAEVGVKVLWWCRANEVVISHKTKINVVFKHLQVHLPRAAQNSFIPQPVLVLSSEAKCVLGRHRHTNSILQYRCAYAHGQLCGSIQAETLRQAQTASKASSCCLLPNQDESVLLGNICICVMWIPPAADLRYSVYPWIHNVLHLLYPGHMSS